MFKFICIAAFTAFALPAFAEQAICVCDEEPVLTLEVSKVIMAEQFSDLKPHLQVEVLPELQFADLKPHLSTFGQFLVQSPNDGSLSNS